MRILVVDDDAGILEAVTDFLAFEGYEVKATGNGNETVSLAKAFKPDVILLDLLLSGRNGSEICEELKQQPDLRDIPVIIMSAHPTARTSALEAGAECFVPKPFEADHLLHLVKQTA